ncbi:MAG TPA: single-stranded DNA-binding protein [Chloroflexia bacterium]|nr:single-stranded DNA-binding protein [Chloroflexia bacterium]
MMSDTNISVLSGRVIYDPEIGTTRNGLPQVRFRLACHHNRRAEQEPGGWQEETIYIPLVAFGALAERIGRIVHKGDLLTITGRINTYSYETHVRIPGVGTGRRNLSGPGAVAGQAPGENSLAVEKHHGFEVVVSKCSVLLRPGNGFSGESANAEAGYSSEDTLSECEMVLTEEEEFPF